MAPTLLGIFGEVSVSVKCISCTWHCTGSNCSECAAVSGSSISALFENLFVFWFYCFSRSNNNYFFLFSEIDAKLNLIFGIVTHNLWVYHWLISFKLTGVIYYSRISLMILANNAKYVDLLSTSTSSTHFHITTSKSSNPYQLMFYIFRYECWYDVLLAKQ